MDVARNAGSRILVMTVAGLLGLAWRPAAICADAGVDVGSDAPPFVLKDLEGKEFDLSEYLGKQVVLLDFWSIYCSTCVEEIPHLLSLYEKYAEKGLVVIGVNMDAYGLPRVKKFIRGFEYKITYPVVIDTLKRDVSRSYQVNLLPTTVLIDKTGKIKLKRVGFKKGDEKELFATVGRLLEE